MTVLEHIVTEHGYKGMAEETKSTSKGRLSSFHRISSYVCNASFMTPRLNFVYLVIEVYLL